jgi:hypothetical protein
MILRETHPALSGKGRVSAIIFFFKAKKGILIGEDVNSGHYKLPIFSMQLRMSEVKI